MHDTHERAPKVWLEDDILWVDYGPNAVISLARVKQAFARHEALAEGRKLPILLKAEGAVGVEFEAQRHASLPKVVALTSAMAIVLSSRLTKHLAKLFLLYHRPPYPTDVFNTEAAALAWLRGYRAPTRQLATEGAD